MKKEVFEKIKEESWWLLGLFLLSLIIFKIIFYKDGFLNIFKIIAAFYWVFVLPGYSIMFYWNNKLKFLERFILGIGLSAAIIGIVSYYLGLLNLHIKYHGYLIPIVLLFFSFFILKKYPKNSK